MQIKDRIPGNPKKLIRMPYNNNDGPLFVYFTEYEADDGGE